MKMQNLGFMFVFIILVGSASEIVQGIKLPANVTIPALIFFGDSIVDQGSNNNLNTLVKCNFPPYGKDFRGGIPTGRFSNARTPADLIVGSASEIVQGIKLPANVSIPALIFFGDSIVDQGSNNNLNTLVKCNFPPYGKDFRGGIPTGRFSNARTPADLIAIELGLKETVPSYLDPNIQNKDLITGVSFASGGTGYDPQTSELVSVLSLSDQLEMFKEYIGKLKGIVGKARTNYILANAIFIVIAGTDDIANTYFTIGIRRLHYNIDSYTDLMVASASKFVQELYKVGARKIGVFGAPPIGCVPSQRTLAGGIVRVCSKKYNRAAQLYNKKLSSMVDSLGSNHPKSRMVYVDIYRSLLNIIQNPSNYGFEVVDRGCCGTGNIEVAVLCNKYSKTCPDVSKFLFWDSYHPTEKGYRILVIQLLKKYLNRFF